MSPSDVLVALGGTDGREERKKESRVSQPGNAAGPVGLRSGSLPATAAAAVFTFVPIGHPCRRPNNGRFALHLTWP